jgi:hypothetical protein
MNPFAAKKQRKNKKQERSLRKQEPFNASFF